MKIEIVSGRSYESRDSKFAHEGKWKLQVGIVMKVEIASMLNYEDRELQICFAMKRETASMLSYENRNCK